MAEPLQRDCVKIRTGLPTAKDFPNVAYAEAELKTLLQVITSHPSLLTSHLFAATGIISSFIRLWVFCGDPPGENSVKSQAEK